MTEFLSSDNNISARKIPFLMMVGIPASGKSTLAGKMAEELQAHVHSSDAIREELFGDASIQGDPNRIFGTMRNRIRRDLAAGIPVIVDATNINAKKRKNFLHDFDKSFPLEKRCIITATSLERCIDADRQRNRHVGESVLLRIRAGFQMPMVSEGWDSIEIVYPYGEQGLYGTADCKYLEYMDYDQHNHHHASTLGEHMLRTRQYLEKRGITDPVLLQAAALHDIGKASTQIFGEDGEAHYYGHANVGAYNSLFLDGIRDPLEVGALITWHMLPYQWKRTADGSFIPSKTAADWDAAFLQKLLLLHEADENSHPVAIP